MNANAHRSPSEAPPPYSPPQSPGKMRSRTARMAAVFLSSNDNVPSGRLSPRMPGELPPLPQPPILSPRSPNWPRIGKLTKRSGSRSEDSKSRSRTPDVSQVPHVSQIQNTPPTPPAASRPFVLELLSHERFPLVLVLPIVLLVAYTVLVAVQGHVHAQHLALERPWTAIARMLEARARQAKWDSVSMIAGIFAHPEQGRNPAVERLAQWIGVAW